MNKNFCTSLIDDPSFLDAQTSNPAQMLEPGNKIYSLKSSERKGFVIGGIVSVTEDNGELFGPSSLVNDPPVQRWTLD